MNNDLIIYQSTNNVITDNNIDYLDIIWKMSNKSKYAKWYIGIIKKAQIRNFKNRKIAKEKLGYVENHHILPSSFGGNNDKNNLVFLSAKEHFVVHHLLVKMINNKKFKNMMTVALWSFINGSRTERFDKITASVFENIKIEYNKANSGENAYWYGKTGELAAHYGQHHSEETKKKLSEIFSGENHPMFGVTGEAHPLFGFKHSEETKQLLSMLRSGENNPLFGYKHSDETKRKQSERVSGEKNPNYGKTGELAAHYGHHHSEETKKKLSEIFSGENSPSYGVPVPLERRQKMSKSHLGIKLSDERKNNMKKKQLIRRQNEKLLVQLFDIWIISNTVPTELIYPPKKPKGFPEKLYYAKELNKRGILKIEE